MRLLSWIEELEESLNLDNRGASWKKMSETVSGATGPHYYQELYASPHEFDKLYLVDVECRYLKMEAKLSKE